jgi:medium-chain acyl-[acyl-carrier-protein] hydrolase
MTMFARRANPWVSIPASRPEAALRLFCFPFAAGGASAYRTWPSLFPPEVEVCGIQLPGREDRFREPLVDGHQAVVAQACGALEPLLDKPFAFFGHSMGALLAFESARRLRRRGHNPVGLFVSACHAPQIPLPRRTLHDLPDDQLSHEIGRLGGTPVQVLQDEELMELMRPVLRADLKLHETYAYGEEPALEAPITAFAAVDDPVAPPAHMFAWAAQTRAAFTLREFSGGHFFVGRHAQSVANVIASVLVKAVPRIPEFHVMQAAHEVGGVSHDT